MRVLLAATLLLASCSAFRQAYRDLNNQNVKGEVAPPIEDGIWVGPGEPEFRKAKWRALAFFKPT